MDDAGPLLERIGSRVPAPQPAFERLARRRGRRRRNRRISSAVLALLIALGGFAAITSAFEGASQPQPAAPTGSAWFQRFATEGHDGRAPIAADRSGLYTLTDGAQAGAQTDVRLTRYAFDGTVVWSRGFGTSTDDDGQAIALQGGDVYVAARSGGWGHYVLLRFTEDGAELWRRELDNPGRSRAIDLAVAPNGVYVSVVAEGANENLLRKYDLNGSVVWSRRFPPYLGAVAADESGVYVLRETYTGPGVAHATLLKFDPEGKDAWSTAVEGPWGGSAVDVSTGGGRAYVMGTVDASTRAAGAPDRGAYVEAFSADGRRSWVRSLGRAGFGIIFSGGGSWADDRGVWVGAFASNRASDLGVTGPFIEHVDLAGRPDAVLQVQPSHVNGESVIEIASWKESVFVSWEQGSHDDPASWEGYVEALAPRTSQ
jgi:hypothetical protein